MVLVYLMQYMYMQYDDKVATRPWWVLSEFLSSFLQVMPLGLKMMAAFTWPRVVGAGSWQAKHRQTLNIKMDDTSTSSHYPE